MYLQVVRMVRFSVLQILQSTLRTRILRDDFLTEVVDDADNLILATATYNPGNESLKNRFFHSSFKTFFVFIYFSYFCIRIAKFGIMGNFAPTSIGNNINSAYMKSIWFVFVMMSDGIIYE